MNVPEIQHLCQSSLYFLCKQFLGFHDWDTVHDDVEKVLRRKSLRKLILIPRGHLKTSVITKGLTIQRILNDFNHRVLITNQVWDKSREMLHEIKGLLTDKSDLPKIFGQFQAARWREDDIEIAQRKKALSAPTIATSGVEAELTSSHYDTIIADDLVGLNNSQTNDQREKTVRYYKSLIDLLEPGGLAIVVGTRYHQADLYDHIIRNESDYYDVTVRSVVENNKIIFPKKFQKRFNAITKAWEPSETHCMDFIDYLKKSKGFEFYSQYMNNPLDEENQRFKKSYFKYWTKRPQKLFISMSIDPAISLKQDSDNFAINVSGMDADRNIYVLDTIKGKWAPSDAIDHIFTTYFKWRPIKVGLETQGFQKSLKYALEEEMRRRNQFFPIHELKGSSNTTKELRINGLEPYYRAGKVYHQNWMHSLEDELMAFPRGRHDDEIDALASQLELLMPGGSESSFQVPANSWEDAFQKARKSLTPYRDFFHD